MPASESEEIESLKSELALSKENCVALENQLKSLSCAEARKQWLNSASLKRTLFQSLSLTANYNLLEFYVEKVDFELENFDDQKTFVSWLTPFSLEDPLQYSCLAIGRQAAYRQTTLYKFKMNSSNFVTFQNGAFHGKFYVN